MAYRQLKVTQVTPAYWRATFDNPPVNLIDRSTVADLAELMTQLESNSEVKVVVFDSNDPEFFLAHYDVLVALENPRSAPPGPSGMHPWLDVLVRLSQAPVLSIAEIAGYARGAGSEFALACDIRFAGANKAVLGQFEVGVGAVPGGNPMARLAELSGRGRTLEIILGADDFTGELAERYGYVNRALPDADLKSFVDKFARRVAGFDKRGLIEAKRVVDKVSLPDNAMFPPVLDSFFQSVARPETRARVGALVEAGLQQRTEVERSLGAYLANDLVRLAKE